MLTFILLIIALIPGIYAHWAGRHLVRESGSPLLAEHWQAYWRRVMARMGWAMVMDIIGVIFVAQVPGMLLEVLPLTCLSTLAGIYSIRKRAFNETWGFWGYLLFNLRLFWAGSGFLGIFILTPSLIVIAGNARWWVWALLAVLLYAQLFFNAWLFKWLLGGKPLAEGHLKQRFDAIAARSTVKPVPLYLIADFKGGHFANAYALPAWPRPYVLFTQTLLDALTVEETEALFAYELAYLEILDQRYLKNDWRWTGFFIALILILVPICILVLGVHNMALLAINFSWMFLLRPDKSRRLNEALANARAAVLCGNADALQSGLRRFQALNLIQPEMGEIRRPHQSLANRLGVIDTLPATPVASDEPLPVAFGRQDKWLVLADDHIHWLEGVPEGAPLEPAWLLARAATVTRFPYRDVASWLIRPAGKLAVWVATDRKGQKWALRLPWEQVPALQAALQEADRMMALVGDFCDGDVAPTPLPTGLKNRHLLIFAAALGILVVGFYDSLLTVQLLTLLALGWLCQPFYTGFAALVWAIFKAKLALPLLALMALCWLCRRSPLPALAALAAYALTMGLAKLLLAWPDSEDMQLRQGLLLAISAAVLVYTLYQSRRLAVTKSRAYRWLVWFLGLQALFVWGLILAGVLYQQGRYDGLTLLLPFDLYHIARLWPEAAASVFGLAAVMWVSRRKFSDSWRPAVLVLVGGLALWFQSVPFGLNLAGDPFAVRATVLKPEPRVLTPLKSIPVDCHASQLWLAPNADWFAYRSCHDGGLMVSDFAGHGSPLPGAFELQFLDGRTLLAVARREGGVLELRLYRQVDMAWAVQTRWTLPKDLADVWRFGSDGAAWWVLGPSDADGQAALRVSGVLAAPQITVLAIDYNKGLLPDWAIFEMGGTLLVSHQIKGDGVVWRNTQAEEAYQELWVKEAGLWRQSAQVAAPYLRCLDTEGEATATPCWTLAPNAVRVGWYHTDSGRVDNLTEIDTRSIDDFDAFFAKKPYHEAKQQDGWLFFKPTEQGALAVALQKKQALLLQLPQNRQIYDLAKAGKYLAVLGDGKKAQEREVSLFGFGE